MPRGSGLRTLAYLNREIEKTGQAIQEAHRQKTHHLAEAARYERIIARLSGRGPGKEAGQPSSPAQTAPRGRPPGSLTMWEQLAQVFRRLGAVDARYGVRLAQLAEELRATGYVYRGPNPKGLESVIYQCLKTNKQHVARPAGYRTGRYYLKEK